MNWYLTAGCAKRWLTLFLGYREPFVSPPTHASADGVLPLVESDAHTLETPAHPAPPGVGINDAAYCLQCPGLGRAFLIFLPLVFTKRTASTLNSFVNVRCPFGMTPSLWRLSSKFIFSGKVSQCHMCRAYYIDHLKVSQTARETGHCRQTVKNVLEAIPRKPYQLRDERPGTKFKPFQKLVEELLPKIETLPPKQRYTTHKLFEILCAEGYQGCESRIGQFRPQWKQAKYPPEVFLPLAFDPGQDAQCDWGDAIAIIAGIRQTVQVFVLRLCYSRRVFVMAFPTQQQDTSSMCMCRHSNTLEAFPDVLATISLRQR
jgi:hypothetical protein